MVDNAVPTVGNLELSLVRFSFPRKLILNYFILFLSTQIDVCTTQIAHQGGQEVQESG